MGAVLFPDMPKPRLRPSFGVCFAAVLWRAPDVPEIDTNN